MLNYQQQLHSLPVGNPGNFYYGPSGSHSLTVSGEVYPTHQSHNPESEDKLNDHEDSTRNMDKMHRFSVDCKPAFPKSCSFGRQQNIRILIASFAGDN